MKKTSIIILLTSIFFIGCDFIKKSKKETPPSKEEITIPEKQEEDIKADETESQSEEKKATEEEVQPVFFSLEKTACLGDCPIFKLIISEDGEAVFIGEEYVEKIGKTEFKLTEEELNKLNELLNKQDFSSYDKKYGESDKTDLPGTFITHKSNKIEIRLWKDIPENLTNAYVYIENMLFEKKFLNE